MASKNPPSTLGAVAKSSGGAKSSKKGHRKGGKRHTASALKALFGDKQTLMYRGIAGATFLGATGYAGYRFGSTGKSMKSLFEIDGKENFLSKYVDPRLAVGIPAVALGAYKRDKTYGKVALAVGIGSLFSWAAEYANDTGFKMGNKAAKGNAPVGVKTDAAIQTPATEEKTSGGIAMIDSAGNFVFSDVGRSTERKADHLERRLAKLIAELRNIDGQNADRFLAAQLSPQGQRLIAPPRPAYGAYGYAPAYAESF